MTNATLLPEIDLRDDIALVTALAAQDVRHLSVAEPVSSYAAIDVTTLIARLADHADPRLREALIPLFLLHPDLAEQVQGLIQRLQPSAADTLRHLYTATVYLQRLWLSTLRMHLGSFPLLPDHFGRAYFHLPAPDVKFGEAGLHATRRALRR